MAKPRAPIADLLGSLVFGRLTFMTEVEPIVRENGSRRRRGLFSCSCGNQRTVLVDNVKMGRTRSCGCLNLESLARNRRRC